MKMIDIGECKKCKIQEWKSNLEQTGGLCFDCYEEAKLSTLDKAEKQQRREDNGYFNQTGKYKGKR